jgi:glycosyltransferase involved in cell wall biosynthesis
MSAEALPEVSLVGYLRAESGVGAAARGYVRALRAAGVHAVLHDVSHLQTNRSRDRSCEPAPSARAAEGVNLVCADVELHYAILTELGEDFFRGCYNVGIWAWELARFPAKWYDRFAYYDEIWVGSSFIANALAPVSPVPVVRVPPPLTPPESGSRPRGRQRLGVADSEFVFLFAFDFHSHFQRKNPLAIVDAFHRAFRAGDHARLVLKCVNAESAPRDFARLQAAAGGRQVSVESGYWSALEVRDLMEACDAYVSLHRAEGTGLTVTDALALGKPVIATGWSGNMDFMSVANSYPVRYELIPVRENVGPYRAGETWAEPSVEHAAELMREVFERRQEAAARGETARRDMESNYSERAVGELIARRLRAIELRRHLSEFRADVAGRFHGYRRLPERLREAVRATVPDESTVLVVSKGDGELLDLGGCVARHFPQRADGQYAGYYPADSAAAVEHLEHLRQSGAGYLLFPHTAFWWLDHYADFTRHLESRHVQVQKDEYCIIYRLAGRTPAHDTVLRGSC